MDLSKYAIIIPARGGSKGIEKKNIVEVKGKPLIFYTIKAAQKIAKKPNIFVSTDSKEIADISKKFGACVPYLRPSDISEDNSSSIDLILDFLNRFPDYQNIILLQPTSPLRTHLHISEAIKIYEEKKAEAVISVEEIDYFPQYFFKEKKGKLQIDETINHLRRQSSDKRYYPNGAIYISSKNNILKNKSFFTKNTYLYLMDSISSIDIDDMYDLELVRNIIR